VRSTQPVLHLSIGERVREPLPVGAVRIECGGHHQSQRQSFAKSISSGERRRFLDLESIMLLYVRRILYVVERAIGIRD
jgi:hypothetical protein